MSEPLILAIESSCDETSAAVVQGMRVLSNVIATQTIHHVYGGVVPELASRAHQSYIVPVVEHALNEAKVTMRELDAVAVTRGPGLMGSLHVGVAFAKSLSIAINKPLIAVNHMHAHIFAHFLHRQDEHLAPSFPFLCLTVSGGHTQLVLVHSATKLEVIGQTIDDAAGEAFDKAAKVMGLPYPGGPEIDRMARGGDENKYGFTRPQVPGLDFSFSGLKTNLLYFLQQKEREDAGWLSRELPHVCASYQRAIVDYLMQRLTEAMHQTGVREVAIAGGVSANGLLRSRFIATCKAEDWRGYIPPIEFATDNAAMIGASATLLYKESAFASLDIAPLPQWRIH
ncbi:MAG: tRNA (adenosine(37)-N6)-threonylcarbamoyltransferase complex transferase subunit TsaD [Flavobacteriales bacterium]